MRRWYTLVWGAMFGGLLASVSEAQQTPGSQQPHRLDRQVRVVLDYLLYLPEDYQQRDAWPLLLFMHGAGERGKDIEGLKKHGPPKMIDAGESFPMIVVSPQCPRRQHWQPIELTALLDEIVEKYKVDPTRIYATGLSMGGYATWAMVAYTPERFAAIVPICGGGDPKAAKTFAHVPAWVFHGEKDKVVPVKRSRKMVKALNKCGGKVQLTIYPDAEHDSWTQTYANPQVWDWMLSQRRDAEPEAP